MAVRRASNAAALPHAPSDRVAASTSRKGAVVMGDDGAVDTPDQKGVSLTGVLLSDVLGAFPSVVFSVALAPVTTAKWSRE